MLSWNDRVSRIVDNYILVCSSSSCIYGGVLQQSGVIRIRVWNNLLLQCCGYLARQQLVHFWRCISGHIHYIQLCKTDTSVLRTALFCRRIKWNWSTIHSLLSCSCCSLIILCIIMAARYSLRIAHYISRCIICVIFLLILLSYTSLATTSLQLLRPLKLKENNRYRTFLSPHVICFTGRHLMYALVALLCEVVLVIGLPLLLLFEPLIKKKNHIDQDQAIVGSVSRML